MTLFPELQLLPLYSLMAAFSSDRPHHDDLEERDLWLQEVAVRIAQAGDEGLSFLIKSIPDADQARLRAIVLAFSFIPQLVAVARSRELKEILMEFLGGKNPIVIAEAIDGLNALGFTDILPNVIPFLNHHSPYVVGSVLRYLSRHYPEKARPILLESLRSTEPIVRQNAVDEIDHLGWVEAIPQLQSLVDDPDNDVRQAVQTALTNLEHGDRENPWTG
jgi:hypothetical protein